MASDELEMFHVGPCQTSFKMGFWLGRRFSQMIQSRLSRERILQGQLLPWALNTQLRPFLESPSNNNCKEFPRYWDELVGTAEGGGVPFLHLADQGYFVEWANLHHIHMRESSLVVHLASTTAAWDSNAVPPTKDEIVAGGIGRNFISRDLLETTSMDEAITTLCAVEASAGRSYNLFDLKARRICDVETASECHVSVKEIRRTPIFRANVYLHLRVNRGQDESSMRRSKRADTMPKDSKDDFLSLLGDSEDAGFPIYMTGPTLHTLCTATVDLDAQTKIVIQGNPRRG